MFPSTLLNVQNFEKKDQDEKSLGDRHWFRKWGYARKFSPRRRFPWLFESEAHCPIVKHASLIEEGYWSSRDEGR